MTSLKLVDNTELSKVQVKGDYLNGDNPFLLASLAGVALELLAMKLTSIGKVHSFSILEALGALLALAAIVPAVLGALFLSIYTLAIVPWSILSHFNNKRPFNPLCIISFHKYGEIREKRPYIRSARVAVGGVIHYECEKCGTKMDERWSAF